LHSYDGPASFAQNGPAALANAIASNTLVMVEEFGALGATKAEVIEEHLVIFNEQLRMPWSIWEICKPGAGESNYEFYVNEPTYGVVWNGTQTSLAVEAAQDFSKYFKDVGGL
jgi:mannan endo-1,4-beta-mannosidase